MVKYVADKIWLINVEKLSKVGRDKISLVKKPGKFIGTTILYKERINNKKMVCSYRGYFEQRTTQVIVEGINNQLKLLKRCRFGFIKFINFEMRSLIFWHFPDNLAQ